MAESVALGMASIDRVVKALEENDGADRELDLAILNVWADPAYRWSGVHEILSGPRDIAVRDLPCDLPPDFAHFCMEHDEHSIVSVPRYTISVDAGAGLAGRILPGRRRFSMSISDDCTSFVEVGWRPEGSKDPRWIWAEGHAPSPARAQIAAILRAFKHTVREAAAVPEVTHGL